MRTIDLIKLSTRMFRTRALRTSLTILGVAVGIGTIVFLVSLGYGLQTVLLEKITTSESLLSLDVFPPDSAISTLKKETIKEFRTMPNVEEVVPIAVYPVQLSSGKTTTDATGNLTDAPFFRLSGLNAQSGALFGEADTNAIVITAAIAELFEWKPEEAVGKKVSVSIFYPDPLTIGPGRKVKDIEAKKEEVVIKGVILGETPIVYIPQKLYSDIAINDYAQAKVRVKNADTLDGVRVAIIDQGFSVSALTDVVDQANKIFKALQVVLAVFGTAALLVSAIGMFNTMTIAFLERTQEIGIMRALGASRSDMFSLFLVESGLMGFLGGACGVLIGYLSQIIVNIGIRLLAGSLGGHPVDLFRTPLWFIVTIICFSTFVGFLTGVVPGRRASRLNPLSALMYK